MRGTLWQAGIRATCRDRLVCMITFIQATAYASVNCSRGDFNCSYDVSIANRENEWQAADL